MRNKLTLLILIAASISISLFYISCQETSDPMDTPTVSGCTDAQAINYNSRATKDDNSCYYAETTTKLKNVLVEIYTAIKAGHCIETDSMASKYQSNNPTRVFIMNVHAGPLSIPGTSDWTDYVSLLGQTLADTAGMSQSFTSYPAVSVNRYSFWDVSTVKTRKMVQDSNFYNLYADGMNAAINNRLTQTSPVNIGLSVKYNKSSQSLSIIAEMYYTSTETTSNFLNIAIVESNLTGWQKKSDGTIDSSYAHNNVLRTLLTGQWGVKLTPTLQKTRVKKTYTYYIPSSVKPLNCNVIAFISRSENIGKGEIISVKGKKVE